MTRWWWFRSCNSPNHENCDASPSSIIGDVPNGKSNCKFVNYS